MFSASAFLCESYAGVSLPTIFASAMSAARIVFSSRQREEQGSTYFLRKRVLTGIG